MCREYVGVADTSSSASSIGMSSSFQQRIRVGEEGVYHVDAPVERERVQCERHQLTNQYNLQRTS